MYELSHNLVESGLCTACMDNTDGIGQSLMELAEASQTAFVVNPHALRLDDIVIKVADGANADAFQLALGAGGDLALVGTLSGEWSLDQAKEHLGSDVQIVGRVEAGEGVYLAVDSERAPLEILGWDYFAHEIPRTSDDAGD